MAYLIIFSPLLGFLITGLLGRKIGDFASQFITCFLIFVSTVISFFIYICLLMVQACFKFCNF